MTPPQLIIPEDINNRSLNDMAANFTRDMASFTAKLQDILKFISDNLQMVEVVETAPVATTMEEIGDEAGKIKSNIKILHHGTQSNRKLYYLYKGTVYLIDSA